MWPFRKKTMEDIAIDNEQMALSVGSILDDTFAQSLPVDQQFRNSMDKILEVFEDQKLQLELVIQDAQQKHEEVSTAINAINAAIASINSDVISSATLAA